MTNIMKTQGNLSAIIATLFAAMAPWQSTGAYEPPMEQARAEVIIDFDKSKKYLLKSDIAPLLDPDFRKNCLDKSNQVMARIEARSRSGRMDIELMASQAKSVALYVQAAGFGEHILIDLEMENSRSPNEAQADFYREHYLGDIAEERKKREEEEVRINTIFNRVKVTVSCSGYGY